MATKVQITTAAQHDAKLLVSSSSFDWDKFANALKDEFGESLVEEDGGEEDAYNWWLTDVTVADIVDFVKNYR